MADRAASVLEFLKEKPSIDAFFRIKILLHILIHKKICIFKVWSLSGTKRKM